MSRVDHPDHYQSPNGLEAIDVIDSFFHGNFHLGNVFKYIARAGRKGDYVEDLEKAAWYLQREISRHRAHEWLTGQDNWLDSGLQGSVPTIPEGCSNDRP